MEEPLRPWDCPTPPPWSYPLISRVRSLPPTFASPMQKAFHPLGGAHFHTQVGPKLARESAVYPLPWSSCLQRGHQFTWLSRSNC